MINGSLITLICASFLMFDLSLHCNSCTPKEQCNKTLVLGGLETSTTSELTNYLGSSLADTKKPTGQTALIHANYKLHKKHNYGTDNLTFIFLH